MIDYNITEEEPEQLVEVKVNLEDIEDQVHIQSSQFSSENVTNAI
jgi:hypothetical protein